MEERIFNLKDTFKIDDNHSKIRGVVHCYDENGNLLFKKENMILKNGRKYIMQNGIKDDTFSQMILFQVSSDKIVPSPEDTKNGENSIITLDTPILETTKKIGITVSDISNSRMY